MTKELHKAFDSLREEPQGDRVEVMKEDGRLFLQHDGARSADFRTRLNAWFPFESRYWPFKHDKYTKNRMLVKGDHDIWVLLLRRDYDPERGCFKHVLEIRKGELDASIHPDTTKAYKGFMLITAGSAMAALLIPKDAEKPID